MLLILIIGISSLISEKLFRVGKFEKEWNELILLSVTLISLVVEFSEWESEKAEQWCLP